MCWVTVVHYDSAGLLQAAFLVYVLDGGETASYDVPCHLHHSLQCYLAVAGAVPIPHFDAACQQKLHRAPAEIGEDVGTQEIQPLVRFPDYSVYVI